MQTFEVWYRGESWGRIVVEAATVDEAIAKAATGELDGDFQVTSDGGPEWVLDEEITRSDAAEEAEEAQRKAVVENAAETVAALNTGGRNEYRYKYISGENVAFILHGEGAAAVLVGKVDEHRFMEV
jgi:hypothetical protein